MRYAMIEYCTDLRMQDSAIRFTQSKRTAEQFLIQAPNPPVSGHRRVRSVYILPTGWKKPSDKFLSQMADNESTSTYRVSARDVLVTKISRVSVQLPNPLDLVAEVVNS